MLNGKVVVTGGAGFIGSNLVRYLLKEGAEVLVIDNLFAGKKEFISDGCAFNKLDIRSEEAKEVVRNFKPDVIVHLAAIHYIPYCNDNPEETFDVNIMGTRNILESYKPELFLFASSAAVYPPLNKPLTEDLHGPIDIYGKTKLIGEDLVKLHNKKAIIARIFNVYGPNDTNPHLIPEIIGQIRGRKRKIKLGNLTPRRDYIHVDDACEAIIALLRHGKEGIYNIGSGTEYSVKEVVEIVSEILSEEIQIVQDKRKMRKIERGNLLADIAKIQNETGWRPKIKLRDGLKDLIISYK
jgi:UDP-glucose 4-epimerase